MLKSIQTAQQWVKDSDAVLITASNGFSITEGLNLFATDDKLHEVLGGLEQTYHLQNLLAAISYDYPNELDKWRVYARITEYYAGHYQPGAVMNGLKAIIGDRPYFIWTSNIDHHFVLAGLDNLLELEGNWLEGICSSHPKEHGTYNLKEQLHQIYLKDQQGTLQETDIPKCDQCGAPLTFNMAGQDFQMNQDQVAAFGNFVQRYQDKRLLILELGIGPQNQMIKAPSMQLVAGAENSRYITINKGQLNIPTVIADRSIGFSSSILDAFEELKTGKDLGIEIEGPAKAQPKLTPEQQKAQNETIKLFFPSYIVMHGIRPGELTMYLTTDSQHQSHFHLVEQDQTWMYSLGDATVAHCFTRDGKYYRVHLGLDKSKKQVHGFYIEAGTVVAFESLEDSGAGFAQISGSFPENASNEILIPKKENLKKGFPQYQEMIERLAVGD
ncbi:cupin domain-containing protein [Lactiplantibacillus plajomi]|uniref:Cupin domain-containing protein n=1 Tax=Lactiplantibacillus plajomi TaxID=1457217 RepID=A0ABV6K6A9_9LACO|nr:cupin domain-containing protein [Lactiplantibacillus plajomi]